MMARVNLIFVVVSDDYSILERSSNQNGSKFWKVFVFIRKKSGEKEKN